VTEKTRAIIAVHLCGQPADLPALREIADRHGLALVEDAAQAYGARYDRRPIGTFGDAATLSFFPSKNLPAMGDGGMVLVRDRDVADRVRMLRFHGSRDKRVFEHIGMNSRLDEMQAAIMRVLLPHVQGWNEARRAAAARYADLGLGELVELPREAPCTSHVYHLYVVRTTERDALAARLRDAGIGAVPYYSMPLHLQPVFASLGYKPGDLPNTERAARESLALPMFPTLDEASQREVVAAVRAAAPAAA
jgi:dTDP-4-amino-4,6-dideoxygalactose transaminase